MSSPRSPRTGREGLVPLVVWAATAAFVGLGIFWSLAAPLGEAPDETNHLALVWHLADGRPYPDFDELTSQAGSYRLCMTYAAATRACPRPGEVVTATSVRRHLAADAPDRSDRPAWDDRGGAEHVGPPNQMAQHPPGYYRAMAAVLQGERAVMGHPLPADRELALLRLVNVILMAPLPFLGWWTARRLGYGDTTARAAALVPFAFPMLTHIGSTLNNDNAFTLCLATTTALAAGVLRGDRSRRTAVAIGVVGGVAFLTKGFAVVIPPLLFGAYLLGARSAESSWSRRLRATVVPLAWAGGLMVAIAGWWYLRVWSRTGRFAPSIESVRLARDQRPPGFSPRVLEFSPEFVQSLVTRFWGSFGWYSVRVPPGVAVVASALVIVPVVVALVPSRDEVGVDRLDRLALLAPMAALGLFVAIRSWDLYVTTGGFHFVQGRYLLGGVVGVAVLVAAGMNRLVGRWAPPVVLLVAAVVQLDAFRRVVPGWWGGPGLGPRDQVRALVAWGAWPGEVGAVAVVASLGACAWLVVAVIRGVRAPPRHPGLEPVTAESPVVSCQDLRE